MWESSEDCQTAICQGLLHTSIPKENTAWKKIHFFSLFLFQKKKSLKPWNKSLCNSNIKYKNFLFTQFHECPNWEKRGRVKKWLLSGMQSHGSTTMWSVCNCPHLLLFGREDSPRPVLFLPKWAESLTMTSLPRPQFPPHKEQHPRWWDKLPYPRDQQASGSSFFWSLSYLRTAFTVREDKCSLQEGRGQGVGLAGSHCLGGDQGPFGGSWGVPCRLPGTEASALGAAPECVQVDLLFKCQPWGGGFLEIIWVPGWDNGCLSGITNSSILGPVG